MGKTSVDLRESAVTSAMRKSSGFHPVQLAGIL
jgi:hypothetical protein